MGPYFTINHDDDVDDNKWCCGYHDVFVVTKIACGRLFVSYLTYMCTNQVKETHSCP